MAIEIKMKMSPKQVGALYMKALKLEEDKADLVKLMSEAVERLSMPVKEIRGEGFRNLMSKLRAEIKQ